MDESARTEHALFVLSSLESLQKKECISDFTIKVRGEEIAVHRVVLAATSEYFVGMFSSGRKESEDGYVEINDTTPVVMKQCIDYIYNGRVKITIEIVDDLLRLASLFQIHGLFRLCEKFLEENINEGNCFLIKALAEKFNVDKVMKSATFFAVQHSDSVITTQGFCELTIEDVVEYVGKLDNSTTGWKVGLAWGEYNQNERREQLAEILAASGLTGCTFEFLFHDVWQRVWVRESDSTAKLAAASVISTLDCSNITVRNCFELLKMTKSYEVTPNEKLLLIQNYMSANLEGICAQDPFKLLDVENIFHLFRSPESQQCRTSIKWKAVLDWVKADAEGRKQHFRELFETLDLQLCDWDLLYRKMYFERLIQQCETCTKEVVSAMLSVIQATDVKMENWLSLLQITREYETSADSDALECLRNFIVGNFLEVIESPDFVKLDRRDVIHVLDYSKSQHFAEDLRWRGATTWIKGDLASREKELRTLVDLLRLENFSFKFLMDVICIDPLAQRDNEMRQKVVKALLAKFVLSSIDSNDIFQMYDIAKQHEESSGVAKEIRKHIVANLQLFVTRKEFVQLESDDFMKLLSEEELNLCLPDLSWEAVTQWIGSDKAARKQHFPEILKLLPLKKYGFSILFNLVLPYAQNFADQSIGVDVKPLILQAIFSKMTTANLNIQNWGEVYTLVNDNINITSAKTASGYIQVFISRNINGVSSSEQFLRMDVAQIPKILKSIPASSNDLKCNAILKWIQEDRMTREPHFGRLLKCINLSSLSCDFLRNVLLADDIVKNSVELKDSIIDALLIKASHTPCTTSRPATASKPVSRKK